MLSQLNKRTLSGLSRRLFSTAPPTGAAKPAAAAATTTTPAAAAAAPSPPPAAAAAPAAPPAPVYSTLPANFAALSPKEKMEISKKNAASINKYFDSLAPAGYDTQIMENMQVDEKDIDYSSQHALEGTPMNYLGRKARVEPATYKSLQSSWGRYVCCCMLCILYFVFFYINPFFLLFAMDSSKLIQACTYILQQHINYIKCLILIFLISFSYYSYYSCQLYCIVS